MVTGNNPRYPNLPLEDMRWLQGFTRSLVRGDLAEDLSQDTLVASMTAHGKGGHPTRSWLARVARNLANRLIGRESRRRQAEQGADAKSWGPSAVDVVGEAELQQKVATEVLALKEPYRTTLLLRFMKELPYQDIAEETRVPLETVRTRVRRGLALLRAKLDGQRTGWRAWLPAIGLPNSGRVNTPELWGLVLMKMKTKVVGTAALLLVGLLAIWYVESPPSSPSGVPQQENVGSMSGDLTRPERVVEAIERKALVPETAPAAPSEDASLLVRVTWQDSGQPAANVGLWVADEKYAGNGRVTFTGEDGTAHFDDLEPGQAWLSMDRVDNPRPIELTGGSQTLVEFEVPRGLDVRGIVVDSDGVGVGGAEVLFTLPVVVPQKTYSIARTSGDGTFFLRSIVRDRLLGARAEGYGTSDFAVVRLRNDEPGTEIPIRLVLPGSPAAIRGTVYDPEGMPVPGARIVVGRPSLAGGSPPQVYLVTDELGAFSATTLRPGRHPIKVSRTGLGSWEGHVDCRPRETTNVVVELQSAAILTGHISDPEGRVLQGIRVSVAGHSANTNAEGRYRIDDIPGGEVAAVVSGGDYSAVRRTLMFTPGQETIWDVTLERSFLVRGILLDHRGEPLDGWWVRYAEAGGPTTDREGRFTLKYEEDGLYNFTVAMEHGFSPTVMEFEGVRPGPDEQRFSVPEDALPSARIRGRILLPDGRPAPDVRMSLRQKWSVHPNPTPYTDDDGHFEIGPLPPGTYQVRGSLPGYLAPELGEVTLTANEIRSLPDTRLADGAGLAVEISSSAPEQLTGLKVVVVDEEGHPVQQGIVEGARASFNQLLPGSYHLSVTGANIEAQLLPIELKAQETLSVEVTLR